MGGVAAVAQFGLVAYVPLYGVDNWALSASAAALVLLVGRIVSVPAKAVAGWMIDAWGAKTSARAVGLAMVGIGLVWLVSPVVIVGATAAVLLAAAAGAMFPMANVVAVDRFGELGGLLGVFRAAQMAIAGIAAWAIGVLGDAIGLTTALGIGVVSLSLVVLIPPSRRRRDGH